MLLDFAAIWFYLGEKKFDTLTSISTRKQQKKSTLSNEVLCLINLLEAWNQQKIQESLQKGTQSKVQTNKTLKKISC